ncbi:snoRNA-binding protein [Lecanora helva]
MAKEKPTDPDKEARRAAKAAKKAAKQSSTNGVEKSTSDKKEKKERKEKKEKKEQEAAAEARGDEAADVEMTTQLLNTLEETKPGSVAIKEDTTGDLEIKVKTAPLLGALVPFANPLADEKAGKKVLKSVKKAAKNKTLKRGVKEVVKSLRQSPLATPSSASGEKSPAVVILAADISPMDVISHLPVLCEDHGIPYIFVQSRAELGSASSTKRPTSVVMVSKEAGRKKGEEKAKEEEEGWEEVYVDLVKVVLKAGRNVKI